MKFVKLRLHNVPDVVGRKTVEEWRCVISNLQDLYQYSHFEGEMMSKAFLQLERTPEGDRFEAVHILDKKVSALAVLLNIRAERLKEGESFSPIEEVGHIFNRKIQSMEKLLLSGYQVCINSVGGFCTLDGFIEAWNAEVVETVEKEDNGFPIDNEALTASTLILENQEKVNSTFLAFVEHQTKTEPVVITHLKEKDQRWVYKSLVNASTLAFCSTFRDREQIDKFLTIFAGMSRKRIIIGHFGDEIKQLTSHSSYQEVAAKHDVEFVDLSKRSYTN